MMHFARLLLWSPAAFLAVVCFVGWATYPDAWALGLLGAISAVVALAWGVFTFEEMRADVAARRATNSRLWAEAERVWIDLDGDGEIDEGEMIDRLPQIVSIRQNVRQSEGDAGFRACRDVLRWAYEQDAAGLSWGQVTGTRRFGQTGYEYALSVFKSMGLVEERRKGKQGALVYPSYDAALATLREKWQEGGGYVKQSAY